MRGYIKEKRLVREMCVQEEDQCAADNQWLNTYKLPSLDAIILWGYLLDRKRKGIVS